ncbi:hypothetical protein AC578_3359 [Pseudocercospora eumusae]|uniref:Actin-like ATPase domain-containing protein n=1 Tax=Pseudocercospora eumusae TaxID=321146 RepID=A0A139HD96_9PEZI|nr:hypothetical protein AC578_3359 [Pseudocercospora eumusae]
MMLAIISSWLLSALCCLAAEDQKLLFISKRQILGIGIDFSPSYATAAASFANGSNIPLAMLEGGDDWRSLMADVSWDKLNHGGPPIVPGSAISTLQHTLEKLMSAGQERLGHPITKAAVSVPASNTISRWGRKPMTDAITAAFSAAGVEFLEILSFPADESLLYPANVLLAGHGLGLCQPHTITEHECIADNTPKLDMLPAEIYYLVGYHPDALELILTHTTTLAYGVNPVSWPNYNLGAKARGQNPEEEFYWEEVRQLLSSPFIGAVPYSVKVTRVILYGTHGEDEKLRSTVRDVLATFLDPEDPLPVWIEDEVDSTYAGALGAAEFAKRQPYWSAASSEVVSQNTRIGQPRIDL